jgi:Mn-dependent DtxR family transcriptional regulator
MTVEIGSTMKDILVYVVESEKKSFRVTEVARNLRFSKSYISTELAKMVKLGLCRKKKDGTYEITPKGRRIGKLILRQFDWVRSQLVKKGLSGRIASQYAWILLMEIPFSVLRRILR